MFSNLEVAIHGCITLSLVHIKEAISKKQELPIPLFFFKKKTKKTTTTKKLKNCKRTHNFKFRLDWISSWLFVSAIYRRTKPRILGLLSPTKDVTLAWHAKVQQGQTHSAAVAQFAVTQCFSTLRFKEQFLELHHQWVQTGLLILKADTVSLTVCSLLPVLPEQRPAKVSIVSFVVRYYNSVYKHQWCFCVRLTV